MEIILKNFSITVHNRFAFHSLQLIYFVLHKGPPLYISHDNGYISPELSSNNDKIVFPSYELHTQYVRDRNNSLAKWKLLVCE